jgi:hypothetical protein
MMLLAWEYTLPSAVWASKKHLCPESCYSNDLPKVPQELNIGGDEENQLISVNMS